VRLGYGLQIVVLLLLAGCVSPAKVSKSSASPNAISGAKYIADTNHTLAGDYHETMAALARVYNESDGIIPKSETFYHTVDSVVKLHKDCAFGKHNYAFLGAKMLSDVTPDFKDGLRWNRSRKWSEHWQMKICGEDVSKSIKFTYAPATGTQLSIH
jgi:hypothetical protein